MFNTFKKALAAGLVAAIALISHVALAEDFPSKPLRIIVPFNPGGGVDTVARIIADNLRENLGAEIIVENKPGGSGMIGANAVVKAAPDGYTVLLGSAGEAAINEFVYKKIQYSPTEDLAPITLVARIPNVMVLSPKVPANTMEEFVAYAKENPGMTYGTSGIGNSQHLNGALLAGMSGLDMVQIPYKGASKQLVDVASGDVDMTFVSYTAARGFITDGKVKALAITAAERAQFDKNIPAIAEYAPLSNYQLENWFGMFAPAGTPADIVDKLNGAIVAALNNDELATKLQNMGGQPAPMTVAEFTAFLATERAQFAEIVKKAGISVE
ncbi:Bug family tripartite tricarboxylate transporter substrate binding protein [Oceanospirillum sanctuarii]|uniref:Bug family tripartite tricarboxylate transporter substrate binding protein n=1 Tax=Oceanospirillum sanctuarii TaxID=1434821 RepID=UPI000A365B9B|nr:tripartite tricarboxylate transporter substrate binding protein [Oceanospirillum sanctuarii]